ncbi:MAG: acyltransferase [Verrucomicrobiota bacterium]|jgi:peptidoglycan/LPS O-acetylase OafA/YrhL
MSGKTISSNSRLPELDGLRAMAILLVLLSHHLLTIPIAWIRYIIEMGWVGVDLFFVLSGFLIGGILLDQRTATNYYGVFYLRRFLRIVPLYGLLVVPGLLILGVGLQSLFAGHSLGSQSMAGMWFCALFLQNVGLSFGYGVPGYLGPTWSVAVEEQFYLLLPPLVRYLNVKTLMKVLVAAILFAPVLRGILIFAFGDTGDTGNNGNPVSRICYFLLPCRWDSLLLGVVCAIAYRDDRGQKWITQQLRGLQIFWCVSALGSIVLLFSSQGHLDPRLGFLGYSVIDVWFACTLLLAVVNPAGGLHRFLSLPAFKPVATVSYGLYLLQSPAAALVETPIRLAHIQYPKIGWTATGVSLLGVMLTVVAAAISWKFYESRMIRMGHQHRYLQPASTKAE